MMTVFVKNHATARARRGSALMTTFILCVVLGGIAMYAYVGSQDASNQSDTRENYSQALAAAEYAAELAVTQLPRFDREETSDGALGKLRGDWVGRKLFGDESTSDQRRIMGELDGQAFKVRVRSARRAHNVDGSGIQTMSDKWLVKPEPFDYDSDWEGKFEDFYEITATAMNSHAANGTPGVPGSLYPRATVRTVVRVGYENAGNDRDQLGVFSIGSPEDLAAGNFFVSGEDHMLTKFYPRTNTLTGDLITDIGQGAASDASFSLADGSYWKSGFVVLNYMVGDAPTPYYPKHQKFYNDYVEPTTDWWGRVTLNDAETANFITDYQYVRDDTLAMDTIAGKNVYNGTVATAEKVPEDRVHDTYLLGGKKNSGASAGYSVTLDENGRIEQLRYSDTGAGGGKFDINLGKFTDLMRLYIGARADKGVAQARKATEKGFTYIYDYNIRHPNGSPHFIHFIGTRLPNANLRTTKVQFAFPFENYYEGSAYNMPMSKHWLLRPNPNGNGNMQILAMNVRARSNASTTSNYQNDGSRYYWNYASSSRKYWFEWDGTYVWQEYSFTGDQSAVQFYKRGQSQTTMTGTGTSVRSAIIGYIQNKMLYPREFTLDEIVGMKVGQDPNDFLSAIYERVAVVDAAGNAIDPEKEPEKVVPAKISDLNFITKQAQRDALVYYNGGSWRDEGILVRDTPTSEPVLYTSMEEFLAPRDLGGDLGEREVVTLMLALEDQPDTGSDLDYNDMVLVVNVVPPVPGEIIDTRIDINESKLLQWWEQDPRNGLTGEAGHKAISSNRAVVGDAYLNSVAENYELLWSAFDANAWIALDYAVYRKVKAHLDEAGLAVAFGDGDGFNALYNSESRRALMECVRKGVSEHVYSMMDEDGEYVGFGPMANFTITTDNQGLFEDVILDRTAPTIGDADPADTENTLYYTCNDVSLFAIKIKKMVEGGATGLPGPEQYLQTYLTGLGYTPRFIGERWSGDGDALRSNEKVEANSGVDEDGKKVNNSYDVIRKPIAARQYVAKVFNEGYVPVLQTMPAVSVVEEENGSGAVETKLFLDNGNPVFGAVGLGFLGGEHRQDPNAIGIEAYVADDGARPPLGFRSGFSSVDGGGPATAQPDGSPMDVRFYSVDHDVWRNDPSATAIAVSKAYRPYEGYAEEDWTQLYNLWGFKDARYSIGFHRDGDGDGDADAFEKLKRDHLLDHFEMVVLGVAGFNPFQEYVLDRDYVVGDVRYRAGTRMIARFVGDPDDSESLRTRLKPAADMPTFVFGKNGVSVGTRIVDGEEVEVYEDERTTVGYEGLIDGAGIMVVNGNLVVRDTFAYHGVLVVLGDVVVQSTVKPNRILYDGEDSLAGRFTCAESPGCCGESSVAGNGFPYSGDGKFLVARSANSNGAYRYYKSAPNPDNPEELILVEDTPLTPASRFGAPGDMALTSIGSAMDREGNELFHDEEREEAGIVPYYYREEYVENDEGVKELSRVYVEPATNLEARKDFWRGELVVQGNLIVGGSVRTEIDPNAPAAAGMGGSIKVYGSSVGDVLDQYAGIGRLSVERLSWVHNDDIDVESLWSDTEDAPNP